MQIVHAGKASTVDGHQSVVIKEELPKAGKVREHAQGQESQLVPGKVEAEEPCEATPAQSRGEVRQGAGVVQ